MSNWIKVDANLGTNKKFFALCDHLKAKDHETMGLLVTFWSWCFENAKDGILCDIHVKSLGRALKMSGGEGDDLFRAMVSCGFVDDDGDGNFFIHDWFDWAGCLHKNRKGNRERKQKQRSHKEVTVTSRGSPKMSRDRVEESRVEESRVEDSLPPASPSVQEPEKPKKEVKQNPWFNICRETFGYLESQGALTKKAEKALRPLCEEQGYGPEEIKRRWDILQADHPDWNGTTFNGLANHWHECKERKTSSTGKTGDPEMKALQDKINARMAANAQE